MKLFNKSFDVENLDTKNLKWKIVEDTFIVLHAITYTYPDGTKSFNRPIDGQIFYDWDTQNNIKDTWQWMDARGQWISIFPGSEEVQIDLIKEFQSLLNCECGAEKSGSNKHSSWCQKHES